MEINAVELLTSLGYSKEKIAEIEKNTPRNIIERYNSNRGKLNLEDGYNCEKCLNRGDFLVKEGDGERIIECECMVIRRAIRELKKSGLEGQIKDLGFNSYKVVDDLTREIKSLAIENLNSDDWFFVGGQTGAGKTHISTAIAAELLRRSVQVRYKRYVEMIQILKNKKFSSDQDYYDELLPLENCKVLYIDDFLKSKPSVADMAILWELIDSRYVLKKKTIISSELVLTDIAKIDESMAGRISERAGKFVVNIEKNKKYNRRVNKI